jgi:hypothetical protein
MRNSDSWCGRLDLQICHQFFLQTVTKLRHDRDYLARTTANETNGRYQTQIIRGCRTPASLKDLRKGIRSPAEIGGVIDVGNQPRLLWLPAEQRLGSVA